MKLRTILAIVLVVPGVSLAENAGQLIIDTSKPVRGTEVEVGLGRQLWNSFGLVVAPAVVKRNWPLYAYYPKTVRGADPCRGESRFAELSVGHDVALVSAEYSVDSSYTGWKIQQSADDVLRFDDLCGVLLDTEQWNRTAGHLALQGWIQPEVSNFGVLRSLKRVKADRTEEWVPLMEGIVLERRSVDDGSDSDFVWNIDSTSYHLIWTSAESIPGHTQTFAETRAWNLGLKIEKITQSNNLFVTSIPMDEGAAPSKRGTWTLKLPAGEKIAWPDVSMAPGSRFMIWYEPPREGGATWYLVSDEPVPGAKSDLRIDRQAFVDG